MWVSFTSVISGQMGQHSISVDKAETQHRGLEVMSTPEQWGDETVLEKWELEPSRLVKTPTS
jgi:hypothetical protein